MTRGACAIPAATAAIHAAPMASVRMTGLQSGILSRDCFRFTSPCIDGTIRFREEETDMKTWVVNAGLILTCTAMAPSLLVSSSPGGLQVRPDTTVDTAFHGVSYVEVMASSTATATAALKRYRDASRMQDGYVRVDLFEQVGRPGHFALVETWRDQKAFDARTAVQKSLQDALQPIRVSDYDQRPYKTLSIGAAPPAANSRAISVVSHVDVTPDPRVATMLKRLAEASRQDEGNVRFDVLQHMMRANHFTVIETWQNQKAFDAHVAAAHTKQYRDELQPMTGSPLDERVYKAIE
jgi:quinol monooxygenase YgiN